MVNKAVKTEKTMTYIN